jgi:exonuclease SbcD
MRILHTSDWHLGQVLHGYDRMHEHAHFLHWLIDTLVTEKVDALLIAGDIFDSANPPASCQRMLYEFVTQARDCLPHLDIIVIAGNHDSASRLEAPSPLLEAMGIKVIGQTSRLADGTLNIERMVIPLKSGGKTAAWCLAVPFLRPGDVPRVEAEDAYAAGTASLYRQALEMALTRRQPDQAIIAMGHCHLFGGRVSELSERRIVIGGAEAMPVELFGAEIAYVALGHLHLAQSVGSPSRRYSGSPLPLSFGESGYLHQVVSVDFDGSTIREMREIPVPRVVPMLQIPDKAKPIEAVIEELNALDLPESEESARPYLEVRVLIDAPLPDLRARIEAALVDKPVRLARIETRQVMANGDDMSAPASLEDLEHLEPSQIFSRLYQQKYGDTPPKALTSALLELLNAEAEGLQ